MSHADEEFAEMESRSGGGGAVVGLLLLAVAFLATLGGVLLILACFR